MAETDGQEKTEQPTQKKLTERRDEGQVAKSAEINSLVVFTSGLLLIYFGHNTLGESLSKISIKIFSSLDVLDLNANTFQMYVKEGFVFLALTVLPVFCGLFVAAFIASISQVGFNLSFKALRPKWTKFNPLNGIKNLFLSSRSIVEILKSLLKLLVITGAVYYVLSDLLLQATSLFEISVNEIVTFMIHSAFELTWKLAIIYSLFSAADFIYQKFNFRKQMMMTRHEVKEETKQSEGDPFTKSRIRKIQFIISRKRMMKEVPKADVVITNPTHYAVALKYDIKNDSAPKVVAKGLDELAKKIKEIAVNNNIPLHEDRELARALYKFCEVGDVIPENLFKAIAQILAYVYQIKNNKKRKMIV